jgi:hypothetical protein
MMRKPLFLISRVKKIMLLYGKLNNFRTGFILHIVHGSM